VPTRTYEHHVRRLLDAFELEAEVSQRSLAKQLGVALGLTNLLVKHLVGKGWVRANRIRPNRMRYLLTPAGILEKTRMSRAYFENSLQFYREARDRIRQRFSTLSANWPTDGAPSAPKRIVFYGAGEVAEIGFVCLVETDLQLIGVVDSDRTKPFFGLTVSSREDIEGLAVNGQPFDVVVVMSFGNPDALRHDVLGLRLPVDRVFWL
jgi:hypothetical protein